MTTNPDPSATSDDREHLDDWRAIGYLVDVATERLTSPVEGIHRAVVRRWFGLAGPGLDPARRVTEGLTGSIYQSIRLSGTAVGMAISSGAELVDRFRRLPPVWETRGGRRVQSIFNGLWGDRFEEDRSPLRIEMGFRAPNGIPYSSTAVSLGHTFPGATGRLVVLVHGFADTENGWRSGDCFDLIDGLESDGFSVLRLRYNTGREIADNAATLADLIEEVCLGWPVPVSEIALVGHSMGGLVARSAIIAAGSAGAKWVRLATHVVAIAAPHFGTPIEQGVRYVSNGLGLFKESRPLGAFLEQRSAGIKSLRHRIGSTDDDSTGFGYHVVAGVITREPDHPLGRVFGDLVVGVGSATGRGHLFETESPDILVVGGRNHADLVHAPEVVAQVRTWLSRSNPAPEAK
ncbi:MAG: alpha/beta fold hydrolase [Acidimicrobiia bacterium]